MAVRGAQDTTHANNEGCIACARPLSCSRCGESYRTITCLITPSKSVFSDLTSVLGRFSRFVTVHGNIAERRNEPQNIEQGTPNVQGTRETSLKWEPQHCTDESGCRSSGPLFTSKFLVRYSIFCGSLPSFGQNHVNGHQGSLSALAGNGSGKVAWFK